MSSESTIKNQGFKWLFQFDDSKSLHYKMVVSPKTSCKKWLFRVPGYLVISFPIAKWLNHFLSQPMKSSSEI